MPLLNGKFVIAEDIDPAQHKFIGMFRNPAPPQSMGYILCPCGQTLQNLETTHSHWQLGHMDTPQYISIKEKE